MHKDHEIIKQIFIRPLMKDIKPFYMLVNCVVFLNSWLWLMFSCIVFLLVITINYIWKVFYCEKKQNKNCFVKK